MKSIKYWLFLLSVIVLPGCKKDDVPDTDEKKEAPVLTQKISGFIQEVMTDVYLWYDKMPEIDIRYEFDAEEYFYKLLYKEDKWSFVTDDIASFENSLQGVETTYGYSLAFGRFVDGSGSATGNLFAVIEYVYPNTPASKAGLVRGDIIVRLDAENITTDNYEKLFSSSSVSVTKGILGSGGISQGPTITLVAEKLNLDPVLMYKIIERNGHKIGYLMYLQYISNYNSTSLNQAFQYFSVNQITDLVLDLRYNPGGYTSAAQYLCSSIAPLSTVNSNSTLVTFQWNDKYQAYWTSHEIEEQIGVNFDASVPVKLGLSKVYILTGRGTASASELTICGLEPYMDVKLVGDSTYGKYTASITLKPEDWYSDESEYKSFKTWGLQPIVIRFANSQGITNFKNGFGPDFLVDDQLMPAYPLGELSEPLLKKAVEDITGETISETKKAAIPPEFQIYYRGFSKFDPQRRNLYIELPENFR